MTQDPWAGFTGHEEAVVAVDPSTGCRMVVALHSTRLGPALGGVRLTAYAGTSNPPAAAYADALRLAEAMSYKNALAGIDHGGGKAVILADSALPEPDRRAVLRAFGRLVADLGGRFVTAGDVGVSLADLEVIAQEAPWVTGRAPEHGGLGDSAILTALGVFTAMQAAAEYAWGSADLTGRTVGIAGVGKVGGRLAHHLHQAGARLVLLASSPESLARRAPDLPPGEHARDLDDLLARDLDILSPNALGGLLTPERAASLRAAVICGGANNQLAEPVVADILAQRGIVYAPDFVVNSGGVIQIAAEFAGEGMEQARERALAIGGTLRTVLDRARLDAITAVEAAQQQARERILRGI